jgi:hypothetical protein
MAGHSRSPLDRAQLTAWVAATEGVEIADAITALMLAEMEPNLTRALAALDEYDIENEPADFRAILTARAEQAP